jgi:hypothetical protein
MSCWLKHEWQPRAVQSLQRITLPTRFSSPEGLPACPITEVLLVCKHCGNLKTVCLDGTWTLEQVSGEKADQDFLKKMRVSL